MKSQISKIAVIGGSGKAGKYLVKQLLNQGYRIKALLRDPERFEFKHPALEILSGNVTDNESVDALAKGSDAIISTLGLGMPPSFPTIFSLATRNIIAAMNAHNINRYVVITGLNVDTVEDKKGPTTKYATDWMYSNFPKSTADRQLEYSLLRESDIDWTLVRLPIIALTDVDHEIEISLKDCPGDKISATSLAQFLVRQLTDTTYSKKAPFIANS